MIIAVQALTYWMMGSLLARLAFFCVSRWKMWYITDTAIELSRRLWESRVESAATGKDLAVIAEFGCLSSAVKTNDEGTTVWTNVVVRPDTPMLVAAIRLWLVMSVLSYSMKLYRGNMESPDFRIYMQIVTPWGSTLGSADHDSIEAEGQKVGKENVLLLLDVVPSLLLGIPFGLLLYGLCD